MRHLKQCFLITIFLLACYQNALAQPIESEPLPPLPGTQAAPEPNAIPLTTPSGAPVSLQRTPSTAPALAPDVSGADNGMSGGGGSVYDMGSVPSAERSGMPASADPAPYSDSAPAAASASSGDVAPPPSISYGGSMGTAPPEKMPPPDKKFCTIKIAFTARGAGADVKTAEKIKSYLASNNDKLTYFEAKGAKPGDYAYCLDVPAHNNRAKIYTGLKRLLPMKAAVRQNTGMTTVSGPGFTPVKTAD